MQIFFFFKVFVLQTGQTIWEWRIWFLNMEQYILHLYLWEGGVLGAASEPSGMFSTAQIPSALCKSELFIAKMNSEQLIAKINSSDAPTRAAHQQ